MLEFVVALTVIAVLTYGLLEALSFVRLEAERTAYEENVRSLETALNYEAMSRHARGEQHRIAQLQNENPFHWVSRTPQGYRGEMKLSAGLEPASWHYDAINRQVIYVPRQPENKEGRIKKIRLKIKFQAAENRIYIKEDPPYVW